MRNFVEKTKAIKIVISKVTLLAFVFTIIVSIIYVIKH